MFWDENYVNEVRAVFSDMSSIVLIKATDEGNTHNNL